MSSGLKLSLALLATFPACSAEHLAGPVSSSSERVSALSASDAGAAPGAEGCPLDSPTGRVRHVIYVQVDGDRVVRDGPDGAADLEPTPHGASDLERTPHGASDLERTPHGASDLEPMPHLLDFVRSRGTLVDNPRAPLAAPTPTSTDLSTSLTGLYPSSQARAAAGAYGSKSAPAPWVPFARAGCNVGMVFLGKTELAGTATDVTRELARMAADGTTELAVMATHVAKRFAVSSPQGAGGASSPAWALADFEGIAIHCAAENSMCSQSRGGVPDLLPDEPGGYTGFRALFGRELAAPVIGPSGPPVDLDGELTTDRQGHAGFPGSASITASPGSGSITASPGSGSITASPGSGSITASPGSGSITASQSLGYVAAMQASGVAVTFARVPYDATDAPDDAAAGAGRAESVARVAAVDRAWGEFVARLASDGITPSNTLFVITVDAGLHGGWLGLVGPGVRHEAATAPIAADRADARPTMLLLAGVQDDYSHDGRALVEAMDEEAIPSAVQVDDGVAFGLVASMYERINAPTGELGLTMLEASTTARADDATYTRMHSAPVTLAEKRDALATEMIQKLEGAEFHARRIDPNAAAALVAHGAELLVEVHNSTR